MKEEIRKKLKIIITSALAIFLVAYVVVMLLRFNSYQNSIFSKDTGIVLSGKTLKIFGKTETLNGFPDRVALHYPYFLVIKADKRLTKVYNIQTQKIIKTYSYPILDYLDGQVVYNSNGYHTYLNEKDLGVFCDQVFIASSSEILCVTRPDLNSLNNILVSINSKTLLKHTVYTPQNVITAVYYEKSTLYIAEYDYQARKGFVVVNGVKANSLELINTFYESNGKVYGASFMSVWNKNTESFEAIYYSNGKVTVQQNEKNKINFN